MTFFSGITAHTFIFYNCSETLPFNNQKEAIIDELGKGITKKIVCVM